MKNLGLKIIILLLPTLPQLALSSCTREAYTAIEIYLKEHQLRPIPHKNYVKTTHGSDWEYYDSSETSHLYSYSVTATNKNGNLKIVIFPYIRLETKRPDGRMNITCDAQKVIEYNLPSAKPSFNN